MKQPNYSSLQRKSHYTAMSAHKTPLKICFINRINDRSETALCLGLKEAGHEVCFISEPEAGDLEQIEQAGIRTIRRKVRHRFDLRTICWLIKFFKKNSFDLVYCPASRPLTATVIASFFTKLKICSYRGTLTRLSKFNLVDRLTHLSPRVSLIICNSKAVKNRLMEFGIPEKKLEVVYKGHDLKWYDVPANPEFSELNIPEDTLILICLANLRPMKGSRILLEALNKLKVQGIKFKLLHIGSISDPDFLSGIKKLELENEIIPLGFRKDAITWLKHADISVMPSLKKESFSRAIVESMSQKIAVISTKIGGMSELITDKETGLLVEPGNADALAESIKILHDSPELRSKLASAGFALIENSFTIKQYLNEYQRCFQSLKEY